MSTQCLNVTVLDNAISRQKQIRLLSFLSKGCTGRPIRIDGQGSLPIILSSRDSLQFSSTLLVVLTYPKNNMVHNHSKQRQLPLANLQSVIRITNIPLVETGVSYAGQLYNKIKTSNNLLYWTFDQAENSFYTVLDTASPAVYLLEGPISTLDKIVCRSLDLVEERVPSINLPPQMIYSNTKQYVSTMGKSIVKPVLKRADSVKQIGNTVLSSKYTAYAADKLDGALNVADKYVEKYLPLDANDYQNNEEVDTTSSLDSPAGKALHTFQHVRMTSRKLKRGLTRRTLAEAKALKEHSAEAIHVLIYVAELVVKDPKLAFQKGRDLWASLSQDEPENQARPENLEQLIVMLTREAARRLVHLINYTSAGVSKVPKHVSRSVMNVSYKLLYMVDSLIKSVHLEGVQNLVVDSAKYGAHKFTLLLKLLNASATDLLEHLATILSSQEKSSENNDSQKQVKSTFQYSIKPENLDTLHPPQQNPQIRASHVHTNNVANGVDGS